MKHRVLLVATFLVTAFTASAQEHPIVPGPDHVLITLSGDGSCGWWAESKNNADTRNYILFWIDGYLSSYNQDHPYHQIAPFPSHGTVSLYMDKWCAEHPLLSYAGALTTMIGELPHQ